MLTIKSYFMQSSISEGFVIHQYPSSFKSLKIILGFKMIPAMTDDLLLSLNPLKLGRICIS